MSDTPVPESRSYRHVKCGEETVVSGQSFETVSNPMSSMEQTYCSSCEQMFPIAEFVWSDTEETIADYYARHSEQATPTQRFLCSKKFMCAVIGTVSVLLAIGAFLLLGGQGALVRSIGVIAALVIGAIAGMAVFLNVFANPITKRVCGVDDTRILT